MAIMRNKTARQHDFAQIPRADIPRSRFNMRQTRKMAFNASELVPIMCEEVLPGDTWQHTESILARLATPIAPLIDDMDLETFYFFVPNRIVWDGWEDFITGVTPNVGVPKMQAREAPANNVIKLGSVLDHFGLPPGTYNFSTQSTMQWTALPIWAYFKIFNDWFRDQNLQQEWIYIVAPLVNTSDITDGPSGYPWTQMPLRINKRHDYFTSSLPWPQKGSPVSIPLAGYAPVVPSGIGIPTFDAGSMTNFNLSTNNGATTIHKTGGAATGTNDLEWRDPALAADLTFASATTINALRLAFQTQKLLERDARGGSRYVEQLLSHFGARSPDYRLQRPEYLGGSKIPITINPIAQTAAYESEPAEAASAIGNLGAEMHAQGHKRTFTYAATEHGYIIGLAAVRATPTYQQGTRRHWRRQNRLDYYFPVFAMLGEQAVATQEIFQPAGTPTNATWGYQERWAEYRYTPNEITGVLRSQAPQPLDWWHLAEEFFNEPALNSAFIQDKTKETLSRALATAPSAQWSAQIIMDILHTNVVARMMPTYSVPGLIDHF